MKSKIKFVYFDVGGVLLRWQEVLHEIAKRHNKSFEKVHEIFLRYDTLACLGKITSKEAGYGLLRELGVVKYTDFDFLAFSLDTFVPILETHRFARKLSKKMPIGLLTNVYHEVFDLALVRGHVPKLAYTTIIQSCKIGMIKPNRDIYEHAREKANVKHEEILFIDDFPINIEGAKKLGWKGIVFDTKHPKKSIQEIEKTLGGR